MYAHCDQHVPSIKNGGHSLCYDLPPRYWPLNSTGPLRLGEKVFQSVLMFAKSPSLRKANKNKGKMMKTQVFHLWCNRVLYYCTIVYIGPIFSIAVLNCLVLFINLVYPSGYVCLTAWSLVCKTGALCQQNPRLSCREKFFHRFMWFSCCLWLLCRYSVTILIL